MNDTESSNRKSSWSHWVLLAACPLLLFLIARICLSVPAVGQADTQPAESNKALYDFLGQPVAPPDGLSPLYTKEGLTDAVQRAAKKAGISLTKVEIDDSEFPYLVGAVSQNGDLDKLNDQISKLPGYSYGGAVGGSAIKAMNMTPHSVYPQKDFYPIAHRLSVRMQVLYYKLENEPPTDAKAAPAQNALPNQNPAPAQNAAPAPASRPQ